MNNLLPVTSIGQTSDSAALQFSVTRYAGFEEEILRLRNANRAVPKTRQYLDWRYTQLPGTPAPSVFWIRSKDRSAVGMASLIFRRYWVDGEPRDIAVLGDISLDEHLRGKGLGRQLIEFVGRYLDQFSPRHFAFVMPTPEAQRSLSAAGWTTAGQLVPHVFLLDPTDALTRLLRFDLLARGAAGAFKRVVAAGLRLCAPDRASLQFVDDVDETFDTFWRNFPKASLTLRDMSQATLRWRYIQHPDRQFKVAKLVNDEGLAGYVIFEWSVHDQICQICDVVVKRPQDLRRMLTLFVRHFQSSSGPSTIRLVLADGHPYARSLWKSGFISRPVQGVFQVRSADEGFDQPAWQITSGDKDV